MVYKYFLVKICEYFCVCSCVCLSRSIINISKGTRKTDLRFTVLFDNVIGSILDFRVNILLSPICSQIP